jgi:hypothetical protein
MFGIYISNKNVRTKFHSMLDQYIFKKKPINTQKYTTTQSNDEQKPLPIKGKKIIKRVITEYEEVDDDTKDKVINISKSIKH